jgi:hypothetical protein
MAFILPVSSEARIVDWDMSFSVAGQGARVGLNGAWQEAQRVLKREAQSVADSGACSCAATAESGDEGKSKRAGERQSDSRRASLHAERSIRMGLSKADCEAIEDQRKPLCAMEQESE